MAGLWEDDGDDPPCSLNAIAGRYLLTYSSDWIYTSICCEQLLDRTSGTSR